MPRQNINFRFVYIIITFKSTRFISPTWRCWSKIFNAIAIDFWMYCAIVYGTEIIRLSVFAIFGIYEAEKFSCPIIGIPLNRH